MRIGISVRENGAALDLTTATAKQVTLQKPDGTVVTPTTSFETTGVDGKIYVDSVAAWLNQAGTWRKQGTVTVSGKTHNTEIVEFQVFEVLS